MSSSLNKASVAEKSQKRKRQSPFRIKVGCVVALRYRPTTGNHVTLVVPPKEGSESNKPTKHALHSLVGMESHVEVWTDPIPGRDEGLALIGRRVRCFFVRPVNNDNNNATTNSDASTKQQQAAASVKTKSYIVEGEIVSVMNYGSQNWLQDRQQGRRKRTNKAGFFSVELLIHRDLLAKASFLERTDEDVDISKLKKESAKRTQRNEEAIRGKNKVTVKVTLADPSALVPLHKNNSDDKKENTTRDIAKWAIRKRIPNKPGEPLEEPKKSKKRKHDGSAEVPSTTTTTTTTKPADGKSDNNTSKSNLTESNQQQKTEKSVLNGKSASEDKTSKEGPASTTSISNDKNENGKPSAAGASGGSGAPSKKKRKLNGGSKKATNLPTQYMGDGNDDTAQQQRNWRWFCARYHDMYLSSFTSNDTTTRAATTTIRNHNNSKAYEYYSELLASCGGFVGEVLEVTPSSKPNTLAMVTLRRLVLPEHSASGRLALHNHGADGGALEVFDDYDSALFDSRKINNDPKGLSDDCQANGGLSSVVFRVPIEELVIVSRRVQRHAKPVNFSFASEDVSESSVEKLHILSSYSLRADFRIPLAMIASENGTTTLGLEHSSLCHRCRRVLSNAAIRSCSNEQCALRQSVAHDEDNPQQTIGWCKSCLGQVDSFTAVIGNKSELAAAELPCCRGHCDCRQCRASFDLDAAQTSFYKAILDASGSYDAAEATAAANSNEQAAVDEKTDALSESISLVKSMRNCAFDIPRELITLQDLPMASGKPITKVKAPGKRGKKQSAVASGRKSPGPGERKKSDSASKSSSSKKARAKDEMSFLSTASATNGRPLQRKVSEDYSVFKPTCARHMDYKEIAASKARASSSENEERPSGDKPRNLRELERKNCSLLTAEKDEKTTSNRRMRASQRRLMKDFSAIGATSLSLDTLAGREQQLRFDRSSIHAWGVFADMDILAGDMIVEYRGELIGNAMAEKREREYELAKIGSDYMFRIDNLVVCDATKQGNVARFINASCDPNCYTKIITSDGKQRIAIYAKKDIKAGEELCYDYKFPLEYDESKRIPCHCGASECRGFMNWDKRYVVMPGTQNGRDSNTTTTAQEAIKQPSE